MKKMITALMCSLVISSGAVFAENEIHPADDVTIYINSRELISEVKPVIVNDRTLIPMRAIFEALGAEVSWNQDKMQATGEKGEKSITLTINSDTASVNGEAQQIDAPAMLINDSTMVPLRVAATALDSEVFWDGATRTINIEDKSTPQKEYEDEKTVVFFGDSLTAGGGGYCQYILHYLTTRYPNTKINYFNAGISGTAVPSPNSTRIEWDVLADKPDIVFMLFGSNDLNTGPFWQSETQVNAETQRKIDTCIQRFSAVIERFQKEGIEVILATPKMYDEAVINGQTVTDDMKGKNEAMRLLGEEIKKLAEKYNCQCADLWKCTTEISDETRKKTGADMVLMTVDRTHPNDLGHLVMAYKYIVDLGYTDTVASVEIDMSSKTVKTENAEVELQVCDENTIKYYYLPNSLPFANVNTYKQSKETLHGINISDINREIIKVSGLADGEYKIYAGNKLMLKATAEELAEGVNIAECATNPGQKKANNSFKLLKTACQFVQSLRGINPAESGISMKEYYKTNFNNDYDKLMEAYNADKNNAELSGAVKYAQTEQSMAEYMANSQALLIPQEYTVRIIKAN